MGVTVIKKTVEVAVMTITAVAAATHNLVARVDAGFAALASLPRFKNCRDVLESEAGASLAYRH